MAGRKRNEVNDALQVLQRSVEKLSDPTTKARAEVALAALGPIFADPSLIPVEKRRRTSRNNKDGLTNMIVVWGNVQCGVFANSGGLQTCN